MGLHARIQVQRRSYQVPIQIHQLPWIMLVSCLGPFSWQEWTVNCVQKCLYVCVHVHVCTFKCMHCISRCEYSLHMCIRCEEWLIGASSDTEHCDILSKLWILTGTDKATAILNHQSGHVMTDHASGTGQTLRRHISVHFGAQRGQTLTGPVSSVVVYWCLPSKQLFLLSSGFGRSLPTALHDLERLCQAVSCTLDTPSQLHSLEPLRCFNEVNNQILHEFKWSVMWFYRICTLKFNKKRLTDFLFTWKMNTFAFEGLQNLEIDKVLRIIKQFSTIVSKSE